MSGFSYQPELASDYWSEIGPFVTECVTIATSRSRYTSADLATAAAPLVLWAWRTAGMDLDARAIFSRSIIDEFVMVGAPQYRTKASKNTLRSRLLRIGEALLTSEAIRTSLRPLGGSDPSAPYTANEITSLKSWAIAQRNAERRTSAEALLALGLGAGLSGKEIIDVRVADIQVDDDGVVVHVGGPRTRTVPVLAAWERALVQQVEMFDSESWAFRKGQTGDNPNLITDFVSRSRGKIQLQARRMRCTWVVHHLTVGTPALPLMAAAGVNSLEAFDRFTKFVPPPELVSFRLALRAD